MKKSFIVLMVLVLVVGVFASCKNEPKEKTEVGTWVYHYSEGEDVEDSTLVLGSDGSAKMTSTGRFVEGGVTTQVSGEMKGTYSNGVITFTSGTATITIGGASSTETMTEPDYYSYSYVSERDVLIIDELDEYTRK